ncbi:uncharacterized protein BCR38DRAFT_76992 [Pseudomassariella vexata]|uniref:Uncharacterized protein n=1 Tax=Pseudomassariella vexata TaxID=1141098 RepID=A0A1Y2DFQ3_9PEZI|nr:uncharacterized protein BCR38DRAFT_76992 [Pseudomassariella vexata]ORY58123.1 hypothetical protein BCR38DRAFT_76992 [Pseudomassariella vexata]
MPMYNSKSESSNSDSSSDSEAENPAVLPATISPAVVNPPVTNHSAAHTSGPSHTGRSPPIANSAATSHPKRKRLSTHGHFDAPEEVWSLRTRNTELENTIRGMEDEFQGILDEERKMHRAELDDQRKKHEQELKAVRERYEKRQDDLIQTIVKLSSVK